jgi:hypothetical protein
MAIVVVLDDFFPVAPLCADAMSNYYQRKKRPNEWRNEHGTMSNYSGDDGSIERIEGKRMGWSLSVTYMEGKTKSEP